ncbi:hypothetical protein [Bacillus sp. TL12]|uniref:hypothetical protein n=1 Tax=Bacillus sp. TL12 TaxID=2894756 RepID=UPI001F519C2A|nr:hypothetical protein [Bacillus sp. TL12]MCI0768370.1 hypothetical protein [Bacillus sp. TL12]
MKTENQILEMIVEQGVENILEKTVLTRNEDLKELSEHLDKFTFKEYDKLEGTMIERISNIQKEFYGEGFKQGVKFILSMQK